MSAKFYKHNILFCSFYGLKIFNHLASLARDIVEITKEKHDGLETLENTEDISDYNIGKRVNPALFAKLIDNTVNHQLENWLKRDIIWAIPFGIGEQNQEHVIRSSTYFTTQVSEKANVRKRLFEYLLYFNPLNTHPAKYF